MSVKLELKGFEDIKPIIDPKTWDKAFRNSANDIAREAFTKTRQSITSKYNINLKKISTNEYAFQSRQTKEIKKTSGHMYIRFAKISDNAIYVTTKAKGGIPLTLFPFTAVVVRDKTKKAVNITKRTKLKPFDKVNYQVKILKKGKPTTLKKSFFAKMKKSGHKGFFYRISEKRLKIKEKRAVSVEYMLENTKYKDVRGFENIFKKIWDEKVDKRMNFWIMRYLGKK